MIDVKNKHVTVVGMGRTSVALARLLLREGAMPPPGLPRRHDTESLRRRVANRG